MTNIDKKLAPTRGEEPRHTFYREKDDASFRHSGKDVEEDEIFKIACRKG